jgi:hypothetical protein
MNKQKNGFLERFRRHARVLAFFLFVSLVPIVNGCYGSFPLTNAVYDLNADVSENKWVRGVMFWVFLIIPFYSLAMFVDAVVLNLIEFWTGEAVDVSTAQADDGTQFLLVPSEDQQEATLTITKPNGDQQIIRFVKTSDTTFDVLDQNNRVAGYVVRETDGTIHLQDAKHHTVRTLDAALIQQARSEAAVQ